MVQIKKLEVVGESEDEVIINLKDNINRIIKEFNLTRKDIISISDPVLEFEEHNIDTSSGDYYIPAVSGYVIFIYWEP